MVSTTALYIPMKSMYRGVKNVMTVQEPRLLSGITMKDARATMKALRENEPVYDALRGQINAMADTTGHKLNILFSETKPGMLEISIAPKSAGTDRELFDEFIGIFAEPSKMKAHWNEFKRILKVGSKLNEGDNIATVTVDPRKNFIAELKEAILKLSENAELKKH